jgi:hypothetical protein
MLSARRFAPTEDSDESHSASEEEKSLWGLGDIAWRDYRQSGVGADCSRTLSLLLALLKRWI